MNSNATAKDGMNALAMVARDDNGIIIHLATIYKSGLSAKFA